MTAPSSRLAAQHRGRGGRSGGSLGDASHGSGGVADLLVPWRRRLRGVALVGGVAVGMGLGLLVAAAGRLVHAPALVIVTLAVAAGGAATAFAFMRSGVVALSLTRTALWLEEREPKLRYALVSAAEGDLGATARSALQRAVGSVPFERAARQALWRSLRLPVGVAAAGIVAFAGAPAGARGVQEAMGEGPVPGASSPDAPLLGTVRLAVAPPPYTGRPASQFDDPTIVRAYPGSRLTVNGTGNVADVHARVDSAAMVLQPRTEGWGGTVTSGSARALLRVQRDGGGSRLIALEPLVDSAPVVTLRSPVRDTVFRTPRGTLPLQADVSDDLGVASGAFEYIVSSGEGERFTFKSGTLGSWVPATAVRGNIGGTLSLEALALAPGDVVHLRAIARDRNDVNGPGVGTSDTRTIRIARADEYDSVAVDQAPPPEVDKSILSQRMLINMTEAVVQRSRSLGRDGVTSEARRIGRDQTRLRKQVSDIIFARLGDGAEAAGEHFHGDGHGHDESEAIGSGRLTPEQLLKAAERATEITGSPTDFEHDETPVVAINRPMLEAYNAMWEAGRALDVGEPAAALPPMYVALAAIQRARAAERLYLRGAPPRVVVDLARVRLQGKDAGTPGRRTPRPSLDRSRTLALQRFARALATLVRDGAAGVDSLIVLRLTVADPLPVAASALEAAIIDLRASRDATASLLRVRRALDDALVVRDSLAAWGSVR